MTSFFTSPLGDVYGYHNDDFWLDVQWKLKRRQVRHELRPATTGEEPWEANFHGLSANHLSIYPWIMLELEHYTLWSDERLGDACDHEHVTRDRYLFTMAALDSKWNDFRPPTGFSDSDGPNSSQYFDAMRVFLMGTEHWILPKSPMFAFMILMRISELMYGSPQACANRRQLHYQKLPYYPTLSIDNPPDKSGRRAYQLHTQHTLDEVDRLMEKIIAKRLALEGPGTDWEHLPSFQLTVPTECFGDLWSGDYTLPGGPLPGEEEMIKWCQVWEQGRFVDTQLDRQLPSWVVEVRHWAIYEHRERRETTKNWAGVALADLLRSRVFLELFGLEKGYFPKSIAALSNIRTSREGWENAPIPPFVPKYYSMVL